MGAAASQKPCVKDDDEEDLEKLQAEIARMEAEAARITKETEELEKKKESKLAATRGGSGDASKTAGGGDAASRDGYVKINIFLRLVTATLRHWI